MQGIRHWFHMVFGFSGGEINGMLILLPLLVASLLSEPLYRLWWGRGGEGFWVNRASLDSLMSNMDTDSARAPVKIAPIFDLIGFDPNRVSRDTLRKMGFSPTLAGRVVKYRQKGGKFIIKSDLLKIYGMDSALYGKIQPFLLLPENKKSFAKNEGKAPKNIQPIRFDLNQADSLSLVRVYGIGPILSLRIRKYRDRLGGFVRLEQVGEVYGLDSLAQRQLKQVAYIAEGFQPHKMDINRAGEKELSSHPYISPRLAKIITAYRFQHGNFRNPEELRGVYGVDGEMFVRILPYLSVHE